MVGKADVPPEDSALFRAEIGAVQPLPTDGKVNVPPALPPAVARSRSRDEAQVMCDSLSDPIAWDDGQETGEELVFLRSGMRRDTLRRLRRGHWATQSELDLHGMIADEARVAVAQFLIGCRARGIRCVRIIHGKGLGSRNRLGVLRNKIGHWLAQRDEVLAYCQARAAEGGSGAVVVLLKAG